MHTHCFSTLFRFLNFISNDVVSTLPTAHMGPLWQAFFFLAAHAVTLCNHRKHRDGLCLLAGGCNIFAALSIPRPRGCVCEIFSHQHSNTIDCPQSISRKKKALMFPVSLELGWRGFMLLLWHDWSFTQHWAQHRPHSHTQWLCKVISSVSSTK